MNNRILNMSSDWVDKFKKLSLHDSEITDLKDKYKDVIADFDHLNSQALNLISMFLALSDQKANQNHENFNQIFCLFFTYNFSGGFIRYEFR